MTTEIERPPTFADEELVIFLGHADDANDLAAAAVTMLHGDFRRALERLAQAAGPASRWSRLRVFDWPEDSVGIVGNQATVIDPYIARADIGIFLFRWRVGKVTWTHELEQFRRAGRAHRVFCAFPDEPPPREYAKDRARSREWAELLDRRDSLIEGYAGDKAHAIVPLPDYRDPEHLNELLFSQLEDWLARHIRKPDKPSPPVRVALDLPTYTLRMQKRYGRLDLDALLPPEHDDGVTLPLPDIFVEPSVREERPPLELPKDIWQALQQEGAVDDKDLPEGVTREDVRRARETYRERPRRPLLDVLGPTTGNVVLLGDPGSGKSTLTRYVLLSLLDTERGDQRVQASFPGALPILIELKHYAAQCGRADCERLLDFVDWLGKTEGYGITGTAIADRLAGGASTLFIFDGLDEIFDSALRDSVIQRIVGFATEHRHVRVVVTSRIVGYSAQTLRAAGFTHFTVQELDEAQILTFAQRWFAKVFPHREDEAAIRIERIRAASQSGGSIRHLTGNPMLLTIMAIMSKHQELPRDRASLYEHAAAVLAQHWGVQKHLEEAAIDGVPFGKHEKLELLRRIAWHMQSGPRGLAGNFLRGDLLHAEVANYLHEHFELPAARAAQAAAVVIRQLRERNFILCRYGAEVYGFVHRSFLEYFSATAILHRFKEKQDLSIEQLQRDIFAAHWQDPTWSEVLRLVIGQLDPRFAGAVINYIAHGCPRSGHRRLQPALPLDVVVATQCLAEVRNLSGLHDVGRRLMSRILRRLELLSGTLGRRGPQSGLALMHRELLPAARSIGTRWPGRDFLLDWLHVAPARVRSFAASSIWCALAADILSDVAIVQELIVQLSHGAASFAVTHAASRVLVALWKAAPPPRSVLEGYAESRAPRVRAAALTALAHSSPAEPHVAQLFQRHAMDDDDEGVRCSALDGMARFHADGAAFAHLADRARNDPSWAVRRTAIHAVTGTAAPALLRELLEDRALHDDDEVVRGDALELLAERFSDDPGVINIAHALLNDDDEDVYAGALRLLVRDALSNSAVRAVINTSIRARASEVVLESAVRVIGSLVPHDDDVRAFVLACAVNHSDSGAREAALDVLSVHGAVEDLAALLVERGCHDDEPSVREQALRLLAASGPAGMVATTLRERALRDESPDVRATALELLADHCAHELTTRTLIEERAACDHAVNVRRAAVAILADRFSNEPLADRALRRRLSEDADPRVRATALELLASRRDAEGLRDIAEKLALTDAAIMVRIAALEILIVQYGDEPAVRELLYERAVGAKTGQVRGWALALLTAYYEADAALRSVLTGRVRQDDHPPVRAQAIALLGSAFARDRQIAELLRVRSVRDADPEVRARALEFISASERDADTRSWLRARASNDSDAKVRAFAMMLWLLCDREYDLIRLASADFDSRPPFLDPRRAMPRDHVTRGRRELHLTEEQFDAMLVRARETYHLHVEAMDS